MLIDSESVKMLIRQHLYLAEATSNEPIAQAMTDLLAELDNIEEAEMQRTVESLING